MNGAGQISNIHLKVLCIKKNTEMISCESKTAWNLTRLPEPQLGIDTQAFFRRNFYWHKLDSEKIKATTFPEMWSWFEEFSREFLFFVQNSWEFPKPTYVQGSF